MSAPTDPTARGISRRAFVGASALLGAGLLLAFRLPLRSRLAEGDGALELEGMLHVGTDGAVHVLVERTEMGQGVLTAMPMIIAEELDADWATVRSSHMPVDAAHRTTHPFQRVTGGSASVRGGWMRLRTVGAQARAMLVGAAAARWGVPAEELRTERGRVLHAPTGRTLTYGELAVEAAAQPVPAKPRLKDRSEFRLVGKPQKRLDTAEKVNGKAVYGVDVRVPGMLTAVIARRATMGGTPVMVDASRARAVAGVKRVVELPDGVAVVADGYWAARKGADALVVQWSAPAGARASSADLDAHMRAAAASPGAKAHESGTAPASATTAVEATYTLPFLAHATMEPMNATAHVTASGVTIWAPTQAQSWLVPDVARELGVDPSTVTVHTTMLGGGFGRKAESDFVLDAVRVSKLVGAPVMVVRSRPEDMKHDFYRPASRHVVKGALDADGWPIAWTHHVAGHASALKRFVPQAIKDGVDPDHVSGLTDDFPYALAHLRTTYAEAETAMPTGFWRSVGHSGTGFAIESFVDELAAAGRKDPIEVRRRLLAGNPRLLAVVNLAAEKSGWGSPLPRGRARGIACAYCFGSYVAQVAEVSVVQGTVKVHRVTCALDCGEVINPDIVKAQMESGVVYGLTAALHGEVTIADGNVKQSSFMDYRVLRINEMPVVETYLVPSAEAPGGVGEVGTPPIAPAVANAIFAATGRRLRELPLRLPATQPKA